MPEEQLLLPTFELDDLNWPRCVPAMTTQCTDCGLGCIEVGEW